MTFLLIAARKSTLANVAAKRLLSRVSAHVGRQMIATAERPEADVALERLLTSVDADVTREFVGAREAAVAVGNGTGVLALVNWNLARSRLTLARFWLEKFSRRNSRLHNL